MPRLTRTILKKAASYGWAVSSLIRTTRSVDLARSEFRWLKQKFNGAQLYKAIKQRQAHRPLQYILGDQQFLDSNIKCREGVLIPRWETEAWVGALLTVLPNKKNFKIMDACTGTGCIAISLAKRLSEAEVIGVDIDQQCLDLAKENMEINKAHVSWHKVDVLRGKLTDETVDLLVSNPPYIVEKDFLTLNKSVKQFEPQLALVGDKEFYKALTSFVKACNCEGFIFEVGQLDQIEYVTSMPWNGWKFRKMKVGGIWRVVYGWRVGGKLDCLSSLPDHLS